MYRLQAGLCKWQKSVSSVFCHSITFDFVWRCKMLSWENIYTSRPQHFFFLFAQTGWWSSNLVLSTQQICPAFCCSGTLQPAGGAEHPGLIIRAASEGLVTDKEPYIFSMSIAMIKVNPYYITPRGLVRPTLLIVRTGMHPFELSWFI